MSLTVESPDRTITDLDSVSGRESLPADRRRRSSTIASFTSLPPPSVVSPLHNLDTYENGALWQYYKGQFDSLPEFNSLAPYSCGIVKTLKVDSTTEETLFDPGTEIGDGKTWGDFAVRFTTKLRIPHAGQWIFYLSSNDGSALYMGGKKIISNDGTHYDQEKEGRIKISAPGLYPITVTFFHKNGKALEGLRTSVSMSLKYYCAGSGWVLQASDFVGKQDIPESELFFTPADRKFVMSQIPDDHVAAETWPSHGDIFDEDGRMSQLQQELRDATEHVHHLQRALDEERRHTRSLLLNIAGSIPSKHISSIAAAAEDYVHPSPADAEDDAEAVLARLGKVRESEAKLMSQCMADITKLQITYFYNLGTTLKIQYNRSDFCVQDAYEKCIAGRVPIEEWPRFLRSEMKAAKTMRQGEGVGKEHLSN
ncbi:hypothetical protein HDV00_001774 [Rhizophlyctis rosea]|nr:hypothetical protein HDV00_001774 [Rhizophlyctis rosea]